MNDLQVKFSGTIHELKLIEPYYSDSASGLKNFEIRKDDRNYQVGDIINLYEYDKTIIGNHHYKQVTYILRDAPYVPDGYVCMACRSLTADPTYTEAKVKKEPVALTRHEVLQRNGKPIFCVGGDGHKKWCVLCVYKDDYDVMNFTAYDNETECWYAEDYNKRDSKSGKLYLIGWLAYDTEFQRKKRKAPGNANTENLTANQIKYSFIIKRKVKNVK